MNRKDGSTEDFVLETEDDLNELASQPGDVELEDFSEQISEETTEETDNESTEEVKEDVEETTDTETTTEEDDIDLSKIFAELDDANDIIDKIEETTENKEELSSLKESLNNMEQLVKKLSNEKADLIYKNAELEAFGSDNTDPKILLLSRNLTKANGGDEQSKTKTISLLKDMLYDLTGEDVDNSKINKDIDLLASIESYNTSGNPNLKKSKSEDENDYGISI